MNFKLLQNGTNDHYHQLTQKLEGKCQDLFWSY